jgi:hypothetical protein
VPLADRIRDLSNRSLTDLAAARAYFEHTKAVWRLAQELTGLGHSFSIPVSQTDMIITLPELAAQAQGYVALYLAESVFQHFVALLEEFIFELLRLWLSAYPGGIPNKDKKSVELATVIDAPDREAILQVVIDRELNALKYERLTAWFRYLNDRVKLGCPSDEQIERFAEIKASRDILAHNRGAVNQTYLDKAGRNARYDLGQRLEVPEPYLHDAWLLIRGIVQDITTAAMAKA